MKTQIIQTIYKNGRYRIVPLTVALAVEVDGRRLQTFDVDQIDLAVQTVDEMAETDGCLAHVSM